MPPLDYQLDWMRPNGACTTRDEARDGPEAEQMSGSTPHAENWMSEHRCLDWFLHTGGGTTVIPMIWMTGTW